jgi:hypothetical protein
MLLFAQIPKLFGLRCRCQKASKSTALGAPVFAEATARQATQEPPSHKATSRQGNQLRFGPACAGKKPQMIPQPREYRTL